MKESGEKLNGPAATPPPARQGYSGWQVATIVLLAVLVTIAASVWLIRIYAFPDEFEPVVLSGPEKQRLDEKLQRLERILPSDSSTPRPVEPTPYSEDGLSRQIRLSETELNALIARDTDLANRLAIDLSDDLASATLLVPVEPDFPILGGRMVRIRAGLELGYLEQRPTVVLKGVSVMGVPVPNAWLGNLKNVDLVREFGGNGGFWQAFADGVDLMRVEDGALLIVLRE